MLVRFAANLSTWVGIEADYV